MIQHIERYVQYRSIKGQQNREEKDTFTMHVAEKTKNDRLGKGAVEEK